MPFFGRSVHLLWGVALVLAMGIAADYGMSPARAGTIASQNPSAILPGIDIGLPPAASPDLGGEERHTSGTTISLGPLGDAPPQGYVRLPGHVVDAINGRASSSQPTASTRSAGRDSLSLTVVLKRDHQAQFDDYLRDVYDPKSSNFRHFLTQSQLADRFGPQRSTYRKLQRYFRDHGLKIAATSKNRLTLNLEGTRRQIDDALAIEIKDFKIGNSGFFANDSDPALPIRLAEHVQSIAGLNNLAMPVPSRQNIKNGLCGGAAAAFAFGGTFRNAHAGILGLVLLAFCIEVVFIDGGFTPHADSAGTSHIAAVLPNAARPSAAPSSVDGSGQTIGLLEFDTFHSSDVANYIDYAASLGINAGQIGNITSVPVNGGVSAPGASEDEVLLDIDAVITSAPGAKVMVYSAPSGGHAADYAGLFNAMISGGATVISNSWASCEDQVSLAEAQGIDSVLKNAAASGISVFNAAGDSGSACLDGGAGTIAVPADSPNATAVGGTSLTTGPGYTYGSEAWWNGSAAVPATGQGGFGLSKYFARPAFQAAVSGAGMRSVPDVVGPADPASGGTQICQDDNGGCPNGLLYGGTSMSAPLWAAAAALLNQSQGKNIGNFNSVLYPLANSSAFHTAASMNSDFAHVGLGSANLPELNRLLRGQATGAVDGGLSSITVVPSTNALIPPGATTAAVPADGASAANVVVTLIDSNHNIVSGKAVTLVSSGGSATITPVRATTSAADGTAVFSIVDLTPETLTLSATDSTDGTALSQTSAVTFGVPTAASGGISANPATVAADGTTAATIVVTLKDALNRPAAGKSVSISNGGSHAVLTGPNPAVTDANGQIQFSATDQVDEAVTFSAVDITDNQLSLPGHATVTYSGSANTACGVNIVPSAGAGYVITPFLSGLPAAASVYVPNVNVGCPGATNPVFTSQANVLEADFLTGGLYKTGLSGGPVSSANVIATLGASLGGLTYGKDGSLYATLGGSGASIIQLDPTTGAIVRTVASNLTCPTGLSVDPLSGDLFFDNDCTGGGLDDASLYRVIDPANTDPARPTAVVVYATLPHSANGAMAFAPNGTLYVVSGYYGNPTAAVLQVSPTTASTVTITPVTGLTSDFAVAIGKINADGSAQSLIVEPSGTLSDVPIANPTAATVLATGAPGVGVTGPDGCLYSQHYDTVYRLANSDGSCGFTPTSPAASMRLTPGTVSPNPAQGTAQTLTVSLRNVSSATGIPVSIHITGANPQMRLARTDANGVATVSYTAAQAGDDQITASATVGGTALVSNTIHVTWTPGQHVSFLSFNASPQAGTVNQATTVTANLSDASVKPAVPVAGQTIAFTLGTSTCSATTDASGIAGCALTPTQVGIGTVSATFAGNSQFSGASVANGFRVAAGATPAPTVTITVSPQTVAAGSAATLTWSSTNSTACTASDAWTGAQATSGSNSVTPSANGTYTYTLSCTGDGGTAVASAVLTASLVAVTVHAKSGGGSLDVYTLIGLMLLVGACYRSRRRGDLNRVIPSLVVVSLSVSLVVTQSSRAGESSSSTTPAWVDSVYVGLRAGDMTVRIDAGRIEAGLADRGFPGLNTSVDKSSAAGTLYAGYEFLPHNAVEVAYTYRNASAATLSGNIASSAQLSPLLNSTAGLIRSYGNIASLSYAVDFEVARNVALKARVGGFFWTSKVSVTGPDDRIEQTHEGGGVTAGITASYRIWRTLEVGINVDHFHGFPSNIATLYGGSLEWRFRP